MKSKVLAINEVSLTIQKTNPPVLVIDVKAEVGNPRWSNCELVQFIYKKPPTNGIYEFDCIADAELDGFIPEPNPIMEAKPFHWKDFPKTMKGVKIYSSDNHLIALLDEKRKFTESKGRSFNKLSVKQVEKLRNKNNPVFITNVFIFEDVLHVSVSYGGGCKKHEFQLVWDGTQTKSIPPQIDLFLIHKSNNDMCEALLTEELQFVLSEHIHQNAVLRIDGWSKELNFKTK